MDQLTPPEITANQNQLKALEGQLRECYGRVAYSHKVHEKCADIYHSRLRWLKLTQIGLSAITTGGLIVTLFGQSQASALVAVVASTALLAINMYTKEHDLGQLAQKHISAAGDLWNVRESYLSLLTDLASGTAKGDRIRNKRDALQEDLKSIYQAVPRTLPKAYTGAQVALQVKEELTFSEEEIDNMLPPSLRRAHGPARNAAQQTDRGDS
jgi:hypothetical protein